jgi:hypothetical protein
MSIPPNIPGDLEPIFRDQLTHLIGDAVRDFLQKDVPALADKEEKELTGQLQAAHKGGKFLGQPIIDETANTVTILIRFTDLSIPGLKGLKLRLARAAFEIERWVNLTHSDKAIVQIDDVPSFAIEISFERGYLISIGGGVDKIQGFKQFRVEISWKAPEIYFRGYLAQRDKGGFLFDVNCRLPFCIPLGPTGLGLKGAGLLYGEHFAPDLREPGSIEPVLQRMEKATAKDYIDWAQKNDLEKWAPVDEGLRVYGISTVFCDAISCGGILEIDEAGMGYISYGPVILLGGKLGLFGLRDIVDVRGAIDVRSRSLFLGAYTKIDVIDFWKGALLVEGSVEISASLSDQSRTWLAVGGYSMNGCAVHVLGIFELRGGLRVVPLQGTAARGSARLEGAGTFCGIGGGYSFHLDLEGRLGWNPVELGGDLGLGGSAWIKVLGVKLGLGVDAALHMELPRPKQLKLEVTFTLSMPWPLSDKSFPITLFDLHDPVVQPPKPPLHIQAGDPLPYFHGPSGTLGQLTVAEHQVWPDVCFELAMLRNAIALPIFTNSSRSDGIFYEGPTRVTHLFTELKIQSIDTTTGKPSTVPNVSACWLMDRGSKGAGRTNRLAIPCNDPLNWLTRFEYNLPDQVVPQDKYVLQTFGVGGTETFEPDPVTANASFLVEDVRISSRSRFWLVPVQWDCGYERALAGCDNYEIEVTLNDGAARPPRPVRDYDLRLIGPLQGPPSLRVTNGTVAAVGKVKQVDDDHAEWSFIIDRTPAQYGIPLQLNGAERPLVVVAVGYLEATWVDYKGGSQTVLRPGNYRLVAEGQSTAAGVAAPVGWVSIARDFEVVRPPLRPYLRYSTAGDERIFGLNRAGWNPNPRGVGFGHYQGDLGLVRSSTGYLSKIYDVLWVQPRKGDPLQRAPVGPCRQGTLAGSRASQDWQTVTGGASPVEEEFTFAVPTDPGVNTLRVFFSSKGDGTDIKPDSDVPLDEWTYRVSRYATSVEHLRPGSDALAYAYGPSGARRVSPVAAAPLPAGFDFSAAPPAEMKAGRALPSMVRDLSDLSETQSGLGFLRLLQWARVLSADALAEESILSRPRVPELSAILDSAISPVALILRTDEPCDWRRVQTTLVTGDFSGAHQRFNLRLSPGPDGCACALIAEAEGVPVRLPAGDLAIEVRFRLDVPDLPRLTRVADRSLATDSFALTFHQPFGATW